MQLSYVSLVVLEWDADNENSRGVANIHSKGACMDSLPCMVIDSICVSVIVHQVFFTYSEVATSESQTFNDVVSLRVVFMIVMMHILKIVKKTYFS